MMLLCRQSHIQINYDSNFYCSFSYKNCKNATMLKKRVVEGDQRRSKTIGILTVIKGNHAALKTSNTYLFH